MDGNMEKECTALGSIFQQIIGDLKVSYDCTPARYS